MKFNSRIHLWIERRLRGTKVEHEETEDAQGVGMENDDTINASFTKPSTFRTGIVQLLTKSAYLHETAGIAAVTKIKGDLEETFRQLDKDMDGRISPDELK